MSEKEIRIYFPEKNYSGGKIDIPLIEGMSLYHALQTEGIALSAPCAGNGICGACKVKVIQGSLPITEKDRKVLSEEQLKDGWRLACQAYPTESCEIYVPTEEFSAVITYEGERLVEAFSAVPTYRGERTSEENKVTKGALFSKKQAMPLYVGTTQNKPYAIAIDLGTTTLVYELFSLQTGETLRTRASVNPQRIYGADVISRIEQSDNGRRDMLKNCIRQGMKKDIAALLQDIDPAKLRSIAISGNTAMIHLFMGYSCEGLGRYPFQPVTLEAVHSDAEELNLLDCSVPVFINGGISAYVGGDILAGVAVQGFTKKEIGNIVQKKGETKSSTSTKMSEKMSCLYIDLGTNAEMALFDGQGKIYVTSAPAGPAFEAANISCGVGSVEGAVSGMSIRNGSPILTTIGDKEPVGFCGSGILEAVYELLKTDAVDETGLLQDMYFEKGYPVGKLKITQQDIRQIQLAKSAVFSAIQILMKRAEISPSQIKKVYLAGGFGYFINIEKAIGIGLLPVDFLGKIQTVGNASLYGTKEILQGRITEEILMRVKNSCKEIYLSNENDFQNIFMENMNFNMRFEA